MTSHSCSLSKEVFDTNRGLWLATSEQELYPNPHGYAKESNQLSWFKFIGRILGKALYQGILVNVKFADFFLAKVSFHNAVPFHAYCDRVTNAVGLLLGSGSDGRVISTILRLSIRNSTTVFSSSRRTPATSRKTSR